MFACFFFCNDWQIDWLAAWLVDQANDRWRVMQWSRLHSPTPPPSRNIFHHFRRLQFSAFIQFVYPKCQWTSRSVCGNFWFLTFISNYWLNECTRKALGWWVTMKRHNIHIVTTLCTLVLGKNMKNYSDRTNKLAIISVEAFKMFALLSILDLTK